MKNDLICIDLADPCFQGAGPLLMKLSHKYMQIMRLSIEDAFQEIALSFFKNIHRYDESRGKISTFAWCVARSAATHYRKKNDRLPSKNNLSFDIGYSEDLELQSTLESLVAYASVGRNGKQSSNYLSDASMRRIAARYRDEFSDIRNSNIGTKTRKSVMVYTKSV